MKKILLLFLLLILSGCSKNNTANIPENTNDIVETEIDELEDTVNQFVVDSHDEETLDIYPLALAPTTRVAKVQDVIEDGTIYGYSYTSNDLVSCEVTALEHTQIEFLCNTEINGKVLMLSAEGLVLQEFPLSDNILFSGLQEATNYSVIVLDEMEQYHEFIAFETMSKLEQIDLQYFITLDSTSAIVEVDIFGYYHDIVNYTLNNEHYHTNGTSLDIILESIQVDMQGNSQLEINPVTSIALDFNQNEGFFHVQYMSLKDYHVGDLGRIQGLLTEEYYIGTGEQILLLPFMWDELEEDVSFSINCPVNWNTRTGYGDTSVPHLFDGEDDKVWWPLTPIQAFDVTKYQTFELLYNDLTFTATIPAFIKDEERNLLIDSWDYLYQLWGSGPATWSKYTLLIANDERQVYGGEFTTGQSYTLGYGIVNEMGIHQFYHVWNGWKYHYSVDRLGQWFSEGFNRYFSHKILEELGDASNGFNYIKNHYYTEYLSMVSQGIVVPIISDSYPSQGYEYNMGAVYLYELDHQIQLATNGDISIDDVLRYQFQEWKESNIPFSYLGMLQVIEELTGTSFAAFYEEYLEGDVLPLSIVTWSDVTPNSEHSAITGAILGEQEPVELFASLYGSRVFENDFEQKSIVMFDENSSRYLKKVVALTSDYDPIYITFLDIFLDGRDVRLDYKSRPITVIKYEGIEFIIIYAPSRTELISLINELDYENLLVLEDSAEIEVAH